MINYASQDKKIQRKFSIGRFNSIPGGELPVYKHEVCR